MKLRAAFVIATTLAAALPAQSADFDLKFAHALPPVHHHFRDVIPEWASRIEKESAGRVKITQYPSGQLLKLPETYDGVKSGVADIGFLLPGLTPGRFPVLSIPELPFMFRTAVSGSRAVMDLHNSQRAFDKDLADMKVLYLHILDLSTIHTRNKPLRTPDDLKGLRIRFPSVPMKDLLAAYGAIPVGVPTPQIYETLEKGVVDGAATGWDSLISLRLGELLKHQLDVPVYTLVFCVCMSKRKFDSMPAQLQKVLLDNSGAAEAVRVAQSYDRARKAGYDGAVRDKHQIYKPTAAEEARWRKAAEPVVEAHLKALEDKGIKARNYHRFLVDAARKYEKQ